LKSVKKQPKPPNNNKAKSFYSQTRKPSILQETNSRDLKSTSIEPRILILTQSKDSQSERNEEGNKKWESETDLKHKTNQDRDRMLDNRIKDRLHPSKYMRMNKRVTCGKITTMNTKHKRKEQHFDDDDDDSDSEVMKLYVNTAVVSDNKKRKLSLDDLE